MKKIITFLILTVIIFSACSSGKDSDKGRNIDKSKPLSWGHPQTIYVFADENIWKYAEDPLRESLERYVFTTFNENYFEIKRAEFKNLEQFYKFNNLIFFCNYESSAEVSSYVREIMGENVIRDIGQNNVGIYPKDNLWANDQFILFLIGNTEENLLKLNILQANKIFELMQEELFRRIERKVYKQATYAQKSFSGYPWSLELPKNYVVFKEDRENNFISYLARLKNKSDRYLVVFYEPVRSEEFGKEWLQKKRTELAWKYYDEDEFKEKDIRLEKYNIAGYEGWKLSGRWQNYKYSVGGAFQSFAFLDKNTEQAYLVDNSVYYPEGYKLTSLIELEIISQSLIIKEE